ncbi:MAG: LysM peptidoglycan-binding domain-containing protein [Planctomycetaceae bacterium]
MDGIDWQADSADASRGTGESPEPIGSVAGGDEGVIDGTVGLGVLAEQADRDAVFSKQWGISGQDAGTMHMLRQLFGTRILQVGVVLVVGLAAASVWWQGDGPDPDGSAETKKPLDDGDAALAADASGVGARGAALLQPVAEASGSGFEFRAASDGHLAGPGALEVPDALRSIPQNEPLPLPEPPSFDSTSAIPTTPTAAIDPLGFGQRPVAIESNATGRESLVTPHPLAGTGERSFESRSLKSRPVDTRSLNTPTTLPISTPDLPIGSVAGGTAAGERGWEHATGATRAGRPLFENGGSAVKSSPAVGLAGGARTLESSGLARPIASGWRSDRVHAVQAGDSYWTISRKYYGTARYFQALSAFNRMRIPDPRRMRPGMRVLIPSQDVLQARFASLLPRRAAADGAARTVGFQIDASGQPVYLVGESDTLTNIATAYLGRTSRWIQIYRLNRDQLPSPHKLKPGTVLRLPADAMRRQDGL